MINNLVKKRSKSHTKLKNRLNINKKLGTKDLTKWLFKRYKIQKNDIILEVGCGVGQHVEIHKKIVGKKGLILATDIASESLKKIKKNKLVIIKKIKMEDLPIYLKKLKIKFDKIISSYAFYYAKDPISLIKKLNFYLKDNGKFLITAPCYPHTLTEFAKRYKSLPKKAESYIDFGSKKLESFLKNKRKKIYLFKNKLTFKTVGDLLQFYRSTVFYKKDNEKLLIKKFNLKNKFEVIKSAKLYEFHK